MPMCETFHRDHDFHRKFGFELDSSTRNLEKVENFRDRSDFTYEKGENVSIESRVFSLLVVPLKWCAQVRGQYCAVDHVRKGLEALVDAVVEVCCERAWDEVPNAF